MGNSKTPLEQLLSKVDDPNIQEEIKKLLEVERDHITTAFIEGMKYSEQSRQSGSQFDYPQNRYFYHTYPDHT